MYQSLTSKLKHAGPMPQRHVATFICNTSACECLQNQILLISNCYTHTYTHTHLNYALWWGEKDTFPCRNQSYVKFVTAGVTYLIMILLRQGSVDRKRWNQCLQILALGRHRAASEDCSWSVLLVQAVPFHNSANTYSRISTEKEQKNYIYII